MATTYPGALDAFTDPNATDTLDGVPHHTQHGNANDAIIQLETKLGTGSSPPAASSVLLGTGAGISSWLAAGTAWTPVISGATTPGTNTYTTQVGRYVRIGPIVIAQFYIVINAVGTAGNAMVGNAQINLPVAVANIANMIGAGAVTANLINLGAGFSWLTVQPTVNASQMLLVQSGDNVAPSTINAAVDVVNGSDVRGCVMYFAA